jgi:hypothetical protein
MGYKEPELNLPMKDTAMQVWSMTDVGGHHHPRYAQRQKPSTVPDLRFSVMGASARNKNGVRLRIAMDAALWKFISAGLHDPRINVHGDAAHGLKVFCKDGEGWKPIIAKHSTSLIVNAIPFKVTFDHVPSMRVDFVQEHEDNGPVLRIPRLPDTFLPDKVLDRLPASQLDPETLEARSAKRREKLYEKADELFRAPSAQPDAYGSPHDEIPGTSENPTPPSEEPEPAPEPQPIEPPGEPEKVQAVAVHDPYQNVTAESDEHQRNVDDLKAAIAMVNELRHQIGPSVMLYVDDAGDLKAKRRVIMYTDL